MYNDVNMQWYIQMYRYGCAVQQWIEALLLSCYSHVYICKHSKLVLVSQTQHKDYDGSRFDTEQPYSIADAELCLCCCPFFSELRDRQICSITVHHLPYRACLHHGALCLLHPPCLFTDSGWNGLMNRMNQITGRGKTLLGRTAHLSPNL